MRRNDLDQLPDTHPAALSLPLLERTEGENNMEERPKKRSWVEIKSGR